MAGGTCSATFLKQQFNAQHQHYQLHYPDARMAGGGAWVKSRSDDFYMEEWPSQIRVIDIALNRGARGKGIGAAILRDVCA
jgi:hypothetical protein